MSDLILMLSVFAVAFGVGYLLISRVPPLLHTPLMSMTNAVSAVTILGAILLFTIPSGAGYKIVGMLALMTAAFNLIGGFVITDRMTRLFKTQQDSHLKSEDRGM
ncbi:MAG: NAD(P) transhydrogenase subunit alpha [candidate division Zixibacteria bacterium]|nr:NAD(P) transhydrogenase subunit alpha [candidate division Zixibacteria bacterium]